MNTIVRIRGPGSPAAQLRLRRTGAPGGEAVPGGQLASAVEPFLVDTYLSMNDHCFPRNSAWEILVEEMVKTLPQAVVTAVPVSVLPTEDLAVLFSHVVLLFYLVQLDNPHPFPSPLGIASVVPSSHLSKAPLTPALHFWLETNSPRTGWMAPLSVPVI